MAKGCDMNILFSWKIKTVDSYKKSGQMLPFFQ